MAAAKPTPAKKPLTATAPAKKPGTAAPAGKPAATKPTTAAAPAAHGPGNRKPMPVKGSKPTVADTKPTTAAPSKAATSGVSAEFEERLRKLEILTLQHELDLGGVGPFADVDENLNVKFDYDAADRAGLRQVAWLFGFDKLLQLSTDEIRDGLKAESKKAKNGFTLKNQGLPPEDESPDEEAAEETEEAAEEGEETEAEETEEEAEAPEYTEEQIESANWKQLQEIAASIGLDVSDIVVKGKPPAPKVLRARILEALVGDGEEAAEWVVDETWLTFTHEETDYTGLYKGVDSDDNHTLEIDGEVYAIPAEALETVVVVEPDAE